MPSPVLSTHTLFYNFILISPYLQGRAFRVMWGPAPVPLSIPSESEELLLVGSE